MTAYQYAMKPKSQPQLIHHNEFTDTELLAFQLNADQYYHPELSTVDNIVTTHDHYIVRPDRVWERLYKEKNKYADKTIHQIKSALHAEWLNNGKAMMRTADAHRYATSLFMLNKYKGEEIPDNAFNSDYLISHT